MFSLLCQVKHDFKIPASYAMLQRAHKPRKLLSQTLSESVRGNATIREASYAAPRTSLAASPRALHYSYYIATGD